MIRRIALAFIVSLLISAKAHAADFNGKWTFEISASTGLEHTTWEFHVDGSKVTGKETNGRWSAEIVDGKVDGDTITFVELIGDARVGYKGTLEGQWIRLIHTGTDGLPNEVIAFRDN